jgi:hypothetical protein
LLEFASRVTLLLRGQLDTNELALQVESCSPRLIASRVDACWRPSGFRPGFWPQGQSNQFTPRSLEREVDGGFGTRP